MFNINSSILTNQNTIKKRLFSWIITENRVLFLAIRNWSHLLGIFVNVSLFCFTSVKRNWPKQLKQSNPMKCQNDWWSHQIAICYFFTIYIILFHKTNSVFIFSSFHSVCVCFFIPHLLWNCAFTVSLISQFNRKYPQRIRCFLRKNNFQY